MYAFVMCAHSVVIVDQEALAVTRWAAWYGVGGLFEKVSFQTAFEGVESG